MTDNTDLIRDILSRSNDVREWPDDEQALHRGWTGDFASRAAAVTELRVQKILDAVTPATLSTKHDFTDGERCTFCQVNQWEISTGENDCAPHPFISYTTETPAKTGPPSGDAGYPGSDW